MICDRESSWANIYTIKQPIHTKSIYEELIKERMWMKKVKVNLVSETITIPEQPVVPIVAMTGVAEQID